MEKSHLSNQSDRTLEAYYETSLLIAPVQLLILPPFSYYKHHKTNILQPLICWSNLNFQQ